MLKIAIIGPESTGKTTLSEQLAKHYETVWVPEYARTYIDQLDRKYTLDDIEVMAKAQMKSEDDLLEKAKRLLICDTNLLVTKIWSEFVFNTCSDWILDEIKNRSYDLHLLTDIDIPWETDPQREHPEQRKELFILYKKELEERNIPYCILSDSKEKRFEEAIRNINLLLRS